jgi:hypothetical protein
LVPKVFLKCSGVRKLSSAIGSLYFSMAVRRTAVFQIQYFIALLQPNSQFVLKVQVHVCLLLSSLYVRCRLTVTSSPSYCTFLIPLLPCLSSSSSSYPLLPTGTFTPKHRRIFGGGKGMCKCPSNICYG